MKKAILFLSVLALAISFSAQAKSIDEIDFYLLWPEEARETCDVDVEIYGCFLPENNTILLSTDIPTLLFDYVLLHEIGHYYTHGQDISLFGDDHELVADALALWVLGGKMLAEIEEYFTKLLSE